MTAALNAESPGTVVNLPAVEQVRREVSSTDVYVRQSSGLVRTVGPRTALIANLVGMGIIVNFFWVVFASAGYPNANLITTVAIGVSINIGVGYVYWMLSSAMPRSGGDYIFVGRIFHPSVGFATNLVFTVVFVTWAGYFAYYLAFYGLPMLFASFSIAGGGSAPLAWANTILSNTGDQFAIGAVFLLLVVLVSLLPTKWIFRTTIGIFVVTFVIYAVMIGILVSTSQSTFASHYNAVNGAGAYQALASAGASLDSITITGTFLGIVYTMLSFIGYANSSYYGGEIRGNPVRTQGLAIFGAPIIFAALIALLYWATYNTFGRNFIVGASGAWFATALPTNLPSPLLLVAYLVSSPWAAGFLTFGISLTFFAFSLIYFIVPTRNLFAWSFDRILPTFLTRVTRNGVPWVAVLFLAAASFLCLYLGVYYTVFAYLSYSNFGFWFAVGLVCLAGALFPFLKKDLFRSAPRIVRAKIGPLPLITLVGGASWIAAWYVSYAASTAQYVEPTGAYSYVDLLFLPIVFVIGLVLYFVSYAIQRARGVPVNLISKALPPD
ncbi:MAG: APC family permease [Thermoplasmata archaeon]